MLIVLGSAVAAPGRRDALVWAAETIASATRADRRCLTYSFAADLDEPDRIHSIEIWQDRAALDEHMSHPHTEHFLRVAPSFVTGDPLLAYYDVASTEAGQSTSRA